MIYLKDDTGLEMRLTPKQKVDSNDLKRLLVQESPPAYLTTNVKEVNKQLDILNFPRNREHNEDYLEMLNKERLCSSRVTGFQYDEEEPMIEKLSDTCYIMKGMASIEEVEETLGQPLPLDADVETLNGFLITKLDKIPKPDEQSKVQISGYEFQILSVVEKTIDRVRVTKVADVSAEEEKTEKIKE